MASSLEFVTYISEQLSESGEITYRKMFGEYGFFCDGKYFACVCDDQFFVKITEAGKKMMPDCETAPPYPGASPCFLIHELDNREFLKNLTHEHADYPGGLALFAVTSVCEVHH